MAQSTANAASSYLHDQSPDISLSRKAHDGGGRVVDGHYIAGHLPPISKKYRVNSALRPDSDHVTDLHNIESGNDLSSSSRLPNPSKVVPTTETSSLSGSSYKHHEPSDAQRHHDITTSSTRNVRVYNRPDGSKFNQDTQQVMDGRESDKTSSNSSNRRDRNHSSEKDSSSTSQWKRLHRIVEQMDDEPCCIILFKWLLIIVGLGMLCVVIEIMGEVLYSWFSGDLEKELLISRIAYKHFSSLNETDESTVASNIQTKELNETLLQTSTLDQMTTNSLTNDE